MAEDPTRDKHYNRVISTLDGHSSPWEHTETYAECEKVCHETTRLSAGAARPHVEKLQNDPALAMGLGEFGPEQLRLLLSDFVREGRVTPIVRDEVRDALEKTLSQWKTEGLLSATEKTNDACMVYVDFKRRFGLTRAVCLQH